MNSTAIEQPVMLAIYSARCTNSLNLPQADITVYRLSLAPALKSFTSVLGLQGLEDLPLHFRPALQTLQWRYFP